MVVLALLGCAVLLRDVQGQGYVAPATGTGSPNDAEYLVGAADGTLSAERVVTDTGSMTWDLATGGVAKAVPLGFVRPTIVLSMGIWPGYNQSGFWAGTSLSSISWLGLTPEDATATRPTVIKGATGTSINDQAYQLSSDNLVNVGHSALFQSWVIGDNTNVLYFLGFMSTALFTSDPTANVAAFRLDTAVGTNYYCFTNDNSGGGTATDSGIASDTNPHRFQIQETNSTNWKFWIDGVLVCTNTTNRPAGASLSYGLTVKTLNAAAKTYRMAYFYVEEALEW